MNMKNKNYRMRDHPYMEGYIIINEKEFRIIDPDEIISRIKIGEDIEYESVYVPDISLESGSHRDIPLEIKGKIQIAASIIKNTGLKNVIFRKEAIFDYTIFMDRADFSGVLFQNAAYFNKTVFNGVTGFIGTSFQNAAGFTGAAFNEVAAFTRSRFNRVNFRDVNFNADANFWDACFNGDADFFDARFSDASFWRARFNGRSSFRGAAFTGEALFRDITYKKQSDFSKLKINGRITFENLNSENAPIDFTETTSGEIVLITPNLINCSFHKSDMRCFSLFNPAWERKAEKSEQSGLTNKRFFRKIEEIFKTRREIHRRGLNRCLKASLSEKIPKRRVIVLRDEKSIYEELREKRFEQLKHRIRDVERIYRELKVKFLDNRDYEKAYWSYYGELEMRRLGRRYPLWEGLYRIASDYGMSWARPLILLFAIFILFTLFSLWIEPLIITPERTRLFEIMNVQYLEESSLPQGMIDFANVFFYHLCSALLINQGIIQHYGVLTLALSRIGTALSAVLIGLSIFAIRRRFRS
jgi:uncharacterized protein YjbI with pentapeptide repeats